MWYLIRRFSLSNLNIFNFLKAKIACSLQEMQIASPTSSHASLLKMSNIQQQFGHHSPAAFIIGSAPTEMANYLNQHVLANNNSNNTTPNTLNLLQQQPMEFGVFLRNFLKKIFF